MFMSYISFNAKQLGNLSFSSKREVIRTNRKGAYMSTTLTGCNTRKYHGLFIVPVEAFGNEKHVLLSQMDESVVVGGTEMNLSVRRFRDGFYEPAGHKYLTGMEFTRIPRFTYQAGSVNLSKERLLSDKEDQLLVRYTVNNANSPVTMRFRPFLAFRNIHSLSKANAFIKNETSGIPNGIRIQLYDNYPDLHMQWSSQSRFVNDPHWYYNIEYEKEKNRGYEYLEDLYTPGYFELNLKNGETVVFSASTKEELPQRMKMRFARELSKRPERHSISDSLRSAASQFTWIRDDSADIIAGFPWYHSISRQTFIALPGLRLTHADRNLGMKVLKTYIPFLNKGLFPLSIEDREIVYDSADASLWFIWAVQQFKKHGCRAKELWELFGDAMKDILENYRAGNFLVGVLENGLLFSADQGEAHTWMNSYSNGRPVVPRYGMPVELNALWYNAVSFCLEMASSNNDQEFVAGWRKMPELIEESFLQAYWDDEKGYLADVFNGLYTDWSVRPNMVIAAALDYSPLTNEQKKMVADLAALKLLTPRGLRSLTPDDPAYRGFMKGNAAQRETAVHTGAVHPWLLQFYAELYLKLHKRSGLSHIKTILDGFREEMTEHCLGTISEMYDGDHPHRAKGSLSQAWNVAALIWCNNLVGHYEKMYK